MSILQKVFTEFSYYNSCLSEHFKVYESFIVHFPLAHQSTTAILMLIKVTANDKHSRPSTPVRRRLLVPLSTTLCWSRDQRKEPKRPDTDTIRCAGRLQLVFFTIANWKSIFAWFCIVVRYVLLMSMHSASLCCSCFDSHDVSNRASDHRLATPFRCYRLYTECRTLLK